MEKHGKIAKIRKNLEITFLICIFSGFVDNKLFNR